MCFTICSARTICSPAMAAGSHSPHDRCCNLPQLHWSSYPTHAGALEPVAQLNGLAPEDAAHHGAPMVDPAAIAALAAYAEQVAQ